MREDIIQVIMRILALYLVPHSNIITNGNMKNSRNKKIIIQNKVPYGFETVFFVILNIKYRR